MAGGHPVGAGADAQPLGGRVAELSGRRLEVAVQLPGALDVQIDPQPRAKVAAHALVAVGGLAEPVVHVERMNLLGP